MSVKVAEVLVASLNVAPLMLVMLPAPVIETVMVLTSPVTVASGNEYVPLSDFMVPNLHWGGVDANAAPGAAIRSITVPSTKPNMLFLTRTASMAGTSNTVQVDIAG